VQKYKSAQESQATTTHKIVEDISDNCTCAPSTRDTLPEFVENDDEDDQAEVDAESSIDSSSVGEVESCDGSDSTQAPACCWSMEEQNSLAFNRLMNRDQALLEQDELMENALAVPAHPPLPSERRNRLGFRAARFRRNEDTGRRAFSNEEDSDALYEDVDWLSMDVYQSPEDARVGFRAPALPRGHGPSAVRFIKLSMRRQRNQEAL
jgi:hypothetical protein